MSAQDLTIFLITTNNNPNYQDCLDSLYRQTLHAEIDIISNYYPISKAFQEMFNRCKTKYLIQVDEDMILYPHAIRTLYNKIKYASDKVAMVAYELHDTHLDFDLYGIKIYNNEIYKQFPLKQNTFSGSLIQIDEVKQAGYTWLNEKGILGLHSPKWTNELIFSRYYDLMDKYKEKKYKWMGELPKKLLEMFKKESNELNLYALLGCLINLLCNKNKPIEKDDSKKNQYFINLEKILNSQTLEFTYQKPIEPLPNFNIFKQSLSVTRTLNNPTTATLSMSSKCNQKCTFCYRQSNTVEQAEDMSIERIKEVRIAFPNVDSFCLCGMGEPLLNKNLDSIFQYLHEQKIVYGLITNGILLKEKMPLISIYKPSYVSVSLNAPNQDLHTQVTEVENKFEQILDGIRLCIRHKITTQLTYVCNKNNLQYIEDFLKLANSLNVLGVHLFNILPHHLIDNKNVQEYLSIVLTTKDQWLINNLKQLPYTNLILSYPVLIDLDNSKRNCQFPWKKFSVNGNGSISICNSVFPPDKKNGNINDKDVWNGDYCTKFREAFLNDTPLACRLCFRNFGEER